MGEREKICKLEYKRSPGVSVVMPVYNGGRYLRKAIESILAQSFRDFEFIIIDDGSTDKTAYIVDEYAKSESRIVLARNKENFGVVKAHNQGLRLAKSDFVAVHHADDIALRKRLEKQKKYLDKHPEVVLLSSRFKFIDSEGKFLVQDSLPKDIHCLAWHLLFGNHLGCHSQVMFRRKVVQELGGYRDRYLFAEDYDLWCRLVAIGKIRILSEALQFYRYKHEDTLSFKHGREAQTRAHEISSNAIREITARNFNEQELTDMRSFILGGRLTPGPRMKTLMMNVRHLYTSFIRKHADHRYRLFFRLLNDFVSAAVRSGTKIVTSGFRDRTKRMFLKV